MRSPIKKTLEPPSLDYSKPQSYTPKFLADKILTSRSSYRGRKDFCPSCHQKRVVEFGEWLCSQVLKRVPHRHFVFSLPKILRRYFLYDRDLLCPLLGFETIPGNWGCFSSQEKASDSG